MGKLAMVVVLLGVAAGLNAQVPAAVQVEVPVLVVDKAGNPVANMDKDWFTLSDNRRSQRIAAIDGEARPLSLAIVVDAYDFDALGQAHRAAQALMAVVGDLGEVSVYIPGPTPQQLCAYTSDRDHVADLLKKLDRSPVAPQGSGLITEPVDMAVKDLEKKDTHRTRAVLMIAKSSARSGSDAQSLVEAEMTSTVLVFRLAPNQPAGVGDDINPISPDVAGSGQGSQRVPQQSTPVDSHGNPGMGSAPYVDLGPPLNAAKAVAKAVVLPHDLDYVYDSGGVTLGASNDAQFDQRLSQIANDLRGIYYLTYTPDDLTTRPARHLIEVNVLQASVGQPVKWFYRHAYLGSRQ